MGTVKWPSRKVPAQTADRGSSRRRLWRVRAANGFYTLLDEHLDIPFDTQILGVTATVERIDMTADDQIVAICRRGRSRQAISMLDLQLPDPPPSGAEWIEAYRFWATSG